MTTLMTRPPVATTGRGWALAGAAGGLIGLAGLLFTAGLTIPGQDHTADNAAFAAAIAGRAEYVWAAQVVCAVTAVCLAVFAAGLRRHLAAQEPAGSLVPGLAAAGIGLIVVLLLVGGGISTELYWALDDVAAFDPDTVGAQVAIYNTMAWIWAGAGLTAAAVAVGGWRHGSVGRPFAVFSAAIAVLIAATQLFPVQYIAVVPAAIWLLVAGVRFALRPAA